MSTKRSRYKQWDYTLFRYSTVFNIEPTHNIIQMHSQVSVFSQHTHTAHPHGIHPRPCLQTNYSSNVPCLKQQSVSRVFVHQEALSKAISKAAAAIKVFSLYFETSMPIQIPHRKTIRTCIDRSYTPLAYNADERRRWTEVQNHLLVYN